MNHLIRIHDGGDLQPFLKQIEKLDLLICDEWGYVSVHRDGAQLLFQVISACYEKRSLILTTNLEFSKWVNIFLDEAMTTAMIDRLIHHSHRLIFDGESHRVKNSLMRRWQKSSPEAWGKDFAFRGVRRCINNRPSET